MNAIRSRGAFEAALGAAWRDRPVLIVGADGFLGYHCAARLAGLGAVVTVLTRRARPRASAFARRVITGDLSDPGALGAALPGQSVVLDLAGASSAVSSNRDPLTNVAEELTPHLGLFVTAARQADPPRVVFVSSRLVYGAPLAVPVDETHPVRPNSAYATHKLALEHHLGWLHAQHGLGTTVLRLANPYGADHGGGGRSYGIINQFIDRVRAGEPITLYGDGRQLRDYVYVDDAVGVLLAAAVEPAADGGTFNLGSGHGTALLDAVHAIARAVGRPARVEHVPWPEAALAVETGDYVTDVSAVRALLDPPPFLDFEAGMALLLEDRARKACGASAP